MKTFILSILFIGLCACSSTKSLESGANPVNRSLLIDQKLGFGIELPGIPIPIPKLNLDFSLHFRRLSPEDEIDLELAKNGKFRTKIPIELPPTGPAPFKATENP